MAQVECRLMGKELLWRKPLTSAWERQTPPSEKKDTMLGQLLKKGAWPRPTQHYWVEVGSKPRSRSWPCRVVSQAQIRLPWHNPFELLAWNHEARARKKEMRWCPGDLMRLILLKPQSPRWEKNCGNVQATWCCYVVNLGLVKQSDLSKLGRVRRGVCDRGVWGPEQESG